MLTAIIFLHTKTLRQMFCLSVCLSVKIFAHFHIIVNPFLRIYYTTFFRFVNTFFLFGKQISLF